MMGNRLWRKPSPSFTAVAALLLLAALLCGAGCLLRAEERPLPQGEDSGAGGATSTSDIRPGGTALLVVAPRDFTDREYRYTRNLLEQEGYVVEVASTGVPEIRGPEGTVAATNLDIRDASADDYVAVVFIGGGGSAQLFSNHDALELAREAYTEGKTVGAICMAPVILARAGILEGKEATAIPSVADHLIDVGAEYTYEAVVIDGNIVTACAPWASDEFAEALADNITSGNR